MVGLGCRGGAGATGCGTARARAAGVGIDARLRDGHRGRRGRSGSSRSVLLRSGLVDRRSLLDDGTCLSCGSLFMCGRLVDCGGLLGAGASSTAGASRLRGFLSRGPRHGSLVDRGGLVSRGSLLGRGRLLRLRRASSATQARQLRPRPRRLLGGRPPRSSGSTRWRRPPRPRPGRGSVGCLLGRDVSARACRRRVRRVRVSAARPPPWRPACRRRVRGAVVSVMPSSPSR